MTNETLNAFYEAYKAAIGGNSNTFGDLLKRGGWLSPSLQGTLGAEGVTEQWLQDNDAELISEGVLKPTNNRNDSLKGKNWNWIVPNATAGPDIDALLAIAEANSQEEGINALSQLAASPKSTIERIIAHDKETDDLCDHVTNMYKCLTILAHAVDGKTSKSSMPGAQISSALKSGANALGTGAKALGTATAAGVGALGYGAAVVGSEAFDASKALAYGATYAPAAIASGVGRIGSIVANDALGRTEQAEAALKKNYSDYNLADQARNYAEKNKYLKMRENGLVSRTLKRASEGIGSLYKSAKESIFRKSEGGSYTRRGRNKRRTFRARRV